MCGEYGYRTLGRKFKVKFACERGLDFSSYSCTETKFVTG